MYDEYGSPSGFDEEEKAKEVRKGPAAPSCYGCKFMVASPMLDCCHPTSLRVLWDPIRNKSYRIPSIMVCREQQGLCSFYEPSSICGAEYFMHKELEEVKNAQLGSVNAQVCSLLKDLIDSGKVDAFMNKLNKEYMKYLTEGMDEEEEEEDY